MKTVFTFCTLILITSAIASPLPSTKPQSVSIAKFTNEFSKFNVHRQAKGVVLDWVFTDPNNVVSFRIERSYDGTFFERVTEVPATGRNQYKDEDVFPGHIYYRVAALMYDGSTIYSNVDVVRIVRNG
jgi:hypothetical protein